MPPMRNLLCGVALCATLVSPPGRAAEPDASAAKPLWGLQGMAGALWSYRPYDPTASSYEFKAVPYLDLSLGDVDLDSEDGLSWNAFKTDNGWSAGPYLNYLPGRDGQGSLRGLRDVSGMGVAGGFVAYSPVQWLSLFARAGRTFGTAESQGGVLGQVGAEADYPLGAGVFGSTRLVAHLANRELNQTFFGVSADESLASGIRPYNAGGGLRDLTLSQSLAVPLSPHWSLLGNLSWTHLTGSAADSSIVQQRGHAEQGEVDIGVAYHF
ncbi:MipA/OmpV family protein [uncultured Pseudomonas sp.]|uniref:MipA/OmpV family protein n=1 Tax=uncultured Pseudomonas sp. TaxID=114707 RepID=UPI0025F8FBD2|nr:MipA/OmpV family protein [uncultured Pseudomonas sp.]